MPHAPPPPPPPRVQTYNTLPPPIPPPPQRQPPLSFRQDALWATCALLFFAYLTAVLYLFIISPTFRRVVVQNANGLFALPYVLSLFVVAVCLAPCAPPPRRDLDNVISSPLDCCLVVLVLLEWATCSALVLITLIAVHEGLSYISPEGLIVPAGDSTVPPDAVHAKGDGISRDALVVLLVPLFFMYTLFNFVLHCFSCTEALWRRRRASVDFD